MSETNVLRIGDDPIPVNGEYSVHLFKSGVGTAKIQRTQFPEDSDSWVDLPLSFDGGDHLLAAVSDEVTDLVVGAPALSFRMPHAFYVTELRLSCGTAPVGSSIIVDVNINGVSILSTKLSIDAGETTSVTAAVPAVISAPTIADDALVTVDIDQVGSSTAGKGLKILFVGDKELNIAMLDVAGHIRLVGTDSDAKLSFIRLRR